MKKPMKTKRASKKSPSKAAVPTAVPTYDQVDAWCEVHDNESIQGWLTSVLDGTFSVEEFRAAVLEDRRPRQSSEVK